MSEALSEPEDAFLTIITDTAREEYRPELDSVIDEFLALPNEEQRSFLVSKSNEIIGRFFDEPGVQRIQLAMQWFDDLEARIHFRYDHPEIYVDEQNKVQRYLASHPRYANRTDKEQDE